MKIKKTRRTGVPKFLRFLYEILSKENVNIISWTENGSAFIIKDVYKFETEVLPKYYKHGKLSSFQRQLNYFNFRKWTKTESSGCTFSHMHFTRGHIENLSLIRKKNCASPFVTRVSDCGVKRPTFYDVVEINKENIQKKRMKYSPKAISDFPMDSLNIVIRDSENIQSFDGVSDLPDEDLALLQKCADSNSHRPKDMGMVDLFHFMDCKPNDIEVEICDAGFPFDFSFIN